jgi:hypothetical protein
MRGYLLRSCGSATAASPLPAGFGTPSPTPHTPRLRGPVQSWENNLREKNQVEGNCVEMMVGGCMGCTDQASVGLI